MRRDLQAVATREMFGDSCNVSIAEWVQRWRLLTDGGLLLFRIGIKRVKKLP